MAAPLTIDATPLERGRNLFERPSCLQLMHAEVMPRLRSYPAPTIWLAEAATEDVLAMTALLHEHGLWARSRVFVSASDEERLAATRHGTLSAGRLAACTAAYRAGGGREELSRFVGLHEGRAHLRDTGGLVWIEHDLEGASFNEFDLIICMRPLAEFGGARRERALRLFAGSLPLLGMLCVMPVLPAPHLPAFSGVVPSSGLYRRVV